MQLPSNINPDALKVVIYPSPVLRQATSEVDVSDPTVQSIVQKMFVLMHESHGVGLAAPQIGLPWRLFVANSTGEPEDDRAYINPVLSNPSDDIQPHEEGCLSLPKVLVEVNRPSAISIEAYDQHGQKFSDRRDDLLARVWQHEFDHLEGRLIIDTMSRMDRMLNAKAIRNLERNA